MVIDISAHLRRLVLAGLPLVAATGCPAGPPDTSSGPAPLLAGGSQCQPRMIKDNWPSGLQVAQLSFQTDDPRVADLYVSCSTEGDYCGRLCQEALLHARPTLGVSTAHLVSDPQGCELRCDQHGRPVLRIAYSVFTGAIGRRPEGFAGTAPTGPGTSLASYFADCARLEGASITAFVVLADELQQHGAPRALVERARLAARDETRHFAQTSRLARRFGAPAIRCPRPARPALRDLPALARENAVEGCVNETYGAAVALWQAAAAGNPEVRSTMAAIAEDELAHAQLAWDVHGWAVGRLTAPVAAEVDAARARAGRRLWDDSRAPVEGLLQLEVGLPGPDAGQALVERMQPLWA